LTPTILRNINTNLSGKIQIITATLLFGFCLGAMYDYDQKLKSLKKVNAELSSTIEEKKRQLGNFDLVCGGMMDPTGQILHLDCGDSFVPRYATCACTLWCLHDYSFATNNLSPKDCEIARKQREEKDL